MLNFQTVTTDRIVPGWKGGTYKRDNIRPSCAPCASKQGGAMGAEAKRAYREVAV